MWKTGMVVLALLLGACAQDTPESSAAACDADNAELELPAGFCARVYADEIGNARHIAAAANGDVYIALEGEGGLAALRDTSGDGRADVIRHIPGEAGTGIALRGDTLWYSTATTVYRARIHAARFGELLDRYVVVRGLPSGGHISRSLTLGDSNTLYVGIGSDSNVCNGADPCVEASVRAAIWRFDAARPDQSLDDGLRYATGIRNAVGLEWNQDFKSLFATQHGRDGLRRFEQYSRRDADMLPSEEFMRVPMGSDFGWPYCYHDWRLNRKVLAPEYGGDGVAQGRCESAARPLMGFPGHWAPNGLAFYHASAFPERYHGGAFIAFHGSFERRQQDGYKVAFVPFGGAMPTGDYEIFADGFAGRSKSPQFAKHRPVGLAVAPDGSLYITDDKNGRIYNVLYVGTPQRGSQ